MGVCVFFIVSCLLSNWYHEGAHYKSHVHDKNTVKNYGNRQINLE